MLARNNVAFDALTLRTWNDSSAVQSPHAEVEGSKLGSHGPHQHLLHEDGKENIAGQHKAYKAGSNALGASKDLDATGVASPRSPSLRPLEQHNSSSPVSSASSPRPTTPGSSPLSPSRHRLAFSSSRPSASEAGPQLNQCSQVQQDELPSHRPSSPSKPAAMASDRISGFHLARNDNTADAHKGNEPTAANDEASQHGQPGVANSSSSHDAASASQPLAAAEGEALQAEGLRVHSPQRIDRSPSRRPPRPMSKPQPESLFAQTSLPQIRKVYPSGHGRPGPADQRRPSGDSSEGAESSSHAGTSQATEQQDSQVLPDSLVEEVGYSSFPPRKLQIWEHYLMCFPSYVQLQCHAFCLAV